MLEKKIIIIFFFLLTNNRNYVNNEIRIQKEKRC